MDKSVIQALIFSVLACTVIIGLAVLLEPTSNVEPIRTAAEAEAFSNSLLGFECVGNNTQFQTTLPHDISQDEYSLYGTPGWRVLEGVETIVTYLSFTECTEAFAWYDDGRIKSSHTIYSLMFNPNNKWVMQQTCDYIGYPERCPKDEAGDYVWIGMRDTLNDPDTETYQALRAKRSEYNK